LVLTYDVVDSNLSLWIIGLLRPMRFKEFGDNKKPSGWCGGRGWGECGHIVQ